MRKIFTILFALSLFVLAILIQLDLVTILTASATSLNSTPTNVYVLWLAVFMFEDLNYSLFINHASTILLFSNIIIIACFCSLFRLYIASQNLSKRRYYF